jgi:hypothetical protein
LTSQSGAALRASGIRIDGDCALDKGFTARSASTDGAVLVSYAQVGGQFLASGARLTNSDGPALHADGVRVGTGMLLDDGFTAEGISDRGAVRCWVRTSAVRCPSMRRASPTLQAPLWRPTVFVSRRI